MSRPRTRHGVTALAVLAFAGLLGAASAAQAGVSPLSRVAATQQIVRVEVANQAEKQQLLALPLDFAEAGGPGYLEVVLHGPADKALLDRHGFDWTVRVADLDAADEARERADAEFEARGVSELPSGSTAYRDLTAYYDEMAALAEQYPDTARLVELPNTSLEGMPVLGLEITNDVEVADGKPVMAMFGLHHAREWPSGELTLEFAYDLLGNAADERIAALLDEVRLISVPVVNPDGFAVSKDVPTMAYKRKNCRVVDGQEPAPGACAMGVSLLPIWPLETGVDPNRNYGGFWGGPGAGTLPLELTYRGAGPFSEPETQNVRTLVSTHQVVTLITNHTYSNLVLRPPGLAGEETTPDEDIYADLGDSMAAQNGYTSQYSYELYDTTGTTEDWSYYATGGLGFTFEIGANEFHPAYEQMAGFYYGEGQYEGKGNREAWLIAMESTANAERHAVISGAAPAGAVLRLHKEFETPTYDGPTFTDTLDTTMVVPDGDTYTWHTNPSTRPLAAKDGQTETWTLTCEREDGSVLETAEVTVARGETAKADLVDCVEAW